MDPQSTLFEMLAFLNDGDWEEAQNAFAELLAWRIRGGAIPNLEAAMDALIEDNELDKDEEAIAKQDLWREKNHDDL